MEFKDKYKLGDIVIGDSTYHGYTRNTVVRITKTQAILNNGVRLKVDSVRGGKEIGSTGYGAPLYRLATPDLESLYMQDFKGRQIKNWFNKLTFKKLSDEELDRLYIVLRDLSNNEKAK